MHIIFAFLFTTPSSVHKGRVRSIFALALKRAKLRSVHMSLSHKRAENISHRESHIEKETRTPRVEKKSFGPLNCGLHVV